MNRGLARPLFAAAAWTVAALALLASVWVVAGSWAKRPQWFAASPSYASHALHRRVSARGVSTIAISAEAAPVRVKTVVGANHVSVTGRLPDELTVTVTRQGGTLTITQQGSVSLGGFPIDFNPSGGITVGQDIGIAVTVPAGATVSVSDQAGSIVVHGQYRTLSVSDQAGSITVSAGVAALWVSDQAGPIAVSDTMPLTRAAVTADAGPIVLSGRVLGTANITDRVGSVAVALYHPTRTFVRARVALGSFTSAFSDIASGSNGTFSGIIGSGGPAEARVTIVADVGSVTLSG